MQKIGRVTGQKVTCEQNLSGEMQKHKCPVKGYQVHVFSKGWLITHTDGAYTAVSAIRFDLVYRDPIIEGDGWTIDEESRVFITTPLGRSDIMEIANVFSFN